MSTLQQQLDDINTKGWAAVSPIERGSDELDGDWRQFTSEAEQPALFRKFESLTKAIARVAPSVAPTPRGL